ncbi:MAG: hypothetical protein LIP77_03465, partial [Planctomycetes bacterium]|nr:hypothetical protein [Planctomycetota bacterium]
VARGLCVCPIPFTIIGKRQADATHFRRPKKFGKMEQTVSRTGNGTGENQGRTRREEHGKVVIHIFTSR